MTDDAVRPMRFDAEVPATAAGRRLDQIAAELFTDFSRARLQAWIRDGGLTVDGARARPRQLLRGGEQLRLEAHVEPDERWQARPGALEIVYQDADLLVIDKPAGLVVHPAVGHRDDTLVNRLLHAVPALATLPRAGIVHRLDKDTSGLMVVACSLAAHQGLVQALQSREVHREYLALVQGVPVGGGVIDAPIGRHPRQRKLMAVSAAGKPARTHYRVEVRYRAHAALCCRLETGRTHQIRVHMAHVRHPLIGDPQYGGRLRLPAGIGAELREALREFRRQALHARKLAFVHPVLGHALRFESPLPPDIVALQELLAEDAGRPES